MPTLEQLIEGRIRIGGTTYKLDEIRSGATGAVVWPSTYTYVIDTSTVTVHYSAGSLIYANATNYAYVTATIRVYQGQTLVQTLTNQTLTPTALSDTVHFAIYNKNIRAYNLGTTLVRGGWSVTVTLGYNTAAPVTATVLQQENTYTQTSSTKTYTGFEITLNETDLPSTGGTVTVTGTAYYDYTPIYTWTSGSTSSGSTTHNNTEAATPSTLTASPSAGVVINDAKTQITFPANTGSTAMDYTISSTWNGFSAAPVIASVNVVTYTYGVPVVTILYEDLGQGYQIGAGEQTVFPLITFTQSRTSSNGDVTTISGSLADGATTGTASDGSTFSLSRINGSSVSGAGRFSTANAGVTSYSRGTTVGSARVAAQYIYVRLQCHGLTGDSYDNHGYVSVTQQANAATTTPESTVYSSVVINGFKIGGSTVTGIPNCTRTAVSVDVRATWTFTAERTDYTSGDYTGGAVTEHINEVVTPAQLFVNGTNMGAISSFYATNQHTTSTKTWTVKATYSGLESDTRSIVQAADSQVTATRNYTASLSVSSNTVSASGGYATLVASAGHEEYKYWASDNQEISGSSSQKTDGVTIVKRSGGTRFTLSGATVTHQNMAKDQTTDTVVYYARNDSQTNAISSDVSLSATNTRSSTPREAGDWHDVGGKSYGTPTYVDQNYSVTLSANAYTSSSNAAPFKGGTYPSLLTFTGSFDRVTTTPWTQGQEGTLYYDYTSGDYDTETGTRTVSGSDVTTEAKTATPSFSSSQSWLSVASNGSVTMAANGNTSVRNASITATLGTASRSVTIYQKRFASISVDVDSIVFTRSGGSITFEVSYMNTTFTISHNGEGTTDPVTGLSPSSGGSATSSGSRTITVSAGQNSGSTNLIGAIHVTPANDELDALEIDVMQEPQQAAGTYQGLASAYWSDSSHIAYEPSIRNNQGSARTFSPTLHIVYTTGTQLPDAGSAVATVALGSVTVPGNSWLVIATGSRYVYKSSSRIYWARLVATDLTSSWEQIEEPES